MYTYIHVHIFPSLLGLLPLPILSTYVIAEPEMSSLRLQLVPESYLLLFCVLLWFSWPCLMSCRILVPRPRMGSVSPAVEVWSPNYWTTTEVPCSFSLLKKLCMHAQWLSSVQSLSRVRLFATPWTAARQASLSITTSWSLPKPMSIESVMPSSQVILSCPLLLLPSVFPSIWVFSNELVLQIV